MKSVQSLIPYCSPHARTLCHLELVGFGKQKGVAMADH